MMPVAYLEEGPELQQCYNATTNVMLNFNYAYPTLRWTAHNQQTSKCMYFRRLALRYDRSVRYRAIFGLQFGSGAFSVKR